MIVGSAWLVTLAQRGEHHADVANKMLRAQTVAYNRLGHDLEIDTEFVRRRVLNAARYGVLADVWISCRRCGCQAKLSSWHAAAALPAADAAAIAVEGRRVAVVELMAYLQPCPGEQYASDIADSPNLPGKRGV